MKKYTFKIIPTVILIGNYIYYIYINNQVKKLPTIRTKLQKIQIDTNDNPCPNIIL